MFLFASLQINRLLKHRLPDDVRKDLETLPEDLSSVYRDIYEAATKTPTNKKFADRAIRWVMYSLRPLTSDELLFAICQDPDDNAIVTPRAEVDEDLILDLCHNILILDSSKRDDGFQFEGSDKPVWRLAHQAVAEFFENHAYCGKTLAHNAVGRVCLMILLDTFKDEDTSCSDDGLQSDNCYECPCWRDITTMWMQRVQHTKLKRPLREYANFAWPTHVRTQEHCGSRSINLLTRTLQQFLGKPEKGSLVYTRWLAHTKFLETPSWSMFGPRKLPTTLNGDDMLPISLACYLGFNTVLAGWWNSLSHNVWFHTKCVWIPWEYKCRRSQEYTCRMFVDGRPRWWSLVAMVCASNEADILKRLLDRGFSFNASRENEVSPILAAVIENAGEAAQELINRGVELCSPFTDRHEHVLRDAIQCDSLKVIGLLLDKLVSKPLVVEGILASVEINHFCSAEAITILVDKDVDVNTPLRDGTLLAAAAYNGWEDLAGRLLKMGANVNMDLRQWALRHWLLYDNAFEAAVFALGRVSILRLLIRHGAHVTTKAVAIALYNAQLLRGPQDEAETMRLLLQNIPDPNEAFEIPAWYMSGITSPARYIGSITCAIVEVLWAGRVDDVKLLIERGASVNPRLAEKTVDTLDMVFRAALSRDVNMQEYPIRLMVDALVNAGASFENLEGDSLDNALAAAARGGLDKTVRAFLDRGASPIAFCNHHWTTALNAAADSRQPESPTIVGMFLDHILGRGADINVYCPDPTPEMSLSYRLPLDFPLGTMLCGGVQLDELNISLQSASVLLSRGAVWDIDIAKWRTCLENMHPDFSQQNADTLNRLQQDLESNRTRFFQDHREAISDERWRIKDPEEPGSCQRFVLDFIGQT